jgi:outer membrane protein TolC
MADLAFTIGLDPSAPIEFSTQYTTREFDGTMDEAISFGHLHQPALLASEVGVEAANHALKASRARYLPTLGGYADYAWSSSTNNYGDDDDSWKSSSGYGLSLSWNVFDGFAREQSVTAAKINRNNSLARSSENRNLVTLEIKKAFLNIDKTRLQQSVAQENVDAATEDLKITEEKYNLGAATILDLLDAQVSLKSAQVLHIQAGFDLNLAVASLENAMGKM